MKQITGIQNLIRRYLLGELDDEEQRRLEEQLLTNDIYFEELLLMEDELIDEYISGELLDQEQERFNQFFLSMPERYQKLRLAKALRRYIEESRSRASPGSATDGHQPVSWIQTLLSSFHAQSWAVSYALAATLIILIGLMAWIGVKNLSIFQHSSPPRSFTITLTPSLVRESGEIKRIDVPAEMNVMELQLQIASDEYQSYRAAVLTDESVEKWAMSGLKAETKGDSKFVILSIPARLLTPGDYQVKLSGLNKNGDYEDMSRYYFRVRK